MADRPKRYRLYIDEFGDAATTAKSLAKDKYLTVVGVAIETEHYRDEFQPALERLKRTHLAYDPDDPPILHKDDIIKRNGAFRVCAHSWQLLRFAGDGLGASPFP